MDNDLGAGLDTANSDQLLSLSFELWLQVLDNEVLNDDAIDFFYTNIDDILNSSTAYDAVSSVNAHVDDMPLDTTMEMSNTGMNSLWLFNNPLMIETLSNLAQLANAYTELDLFQAPLEAAEAEIPVAGGVSSAPQATSKVQWPGSYYTCDIAAGFEKMDIMRGGVESKSRRKGNTLWDQFDAAFPEVHYVKSTVNKAFKYYHAFVKHDSGLLQQFISLGYANEGKWSKFCLQAKEIESSLC
ncbi:hypothetical protein GYMLUDRAFT_240964 [Collybiopsis luxurians FD-317 M1]|nr:hypothetical protein GYMLUDRAFT_240964 [Collybiopsis luxurians FD-317 M1]